MGFREIVHFWSNLESCCGLVLRWIWKSTFRWQYRLQQANRIPDLQFAFLRRWSIWGRRDNTFAAIGQNLFSLFPSFVIPTFYQACPKSQSLLILRGWVRAEVRTLGRRILNCPWSSKPVLVNQPPGENKNLKNPPIPECQWSKGIASGRSDSQS